jgi:Xaa-Pro dipeptidase
MGVDRRDFLKITAGAAGALGLAGCRPGEERAEKTDASPSGKAGPLARLKPMTEGIVPISDEERLARQEKARRLMIENGIDAVIIEGGSSMFYFTGTRWGHSERTFACVIPARGEMAWICPKFEEDRALEVIRFGKDVRTWEEDESPYKLFAGLFNEKGITTGRIGFEERLRFFISEGIRKEAPALEYVSADPVTIGCRSIKSPAEITLMQKANDVTVEAYKAAIAMLREGMSKGDFRSNASAAFAALGFSGGIGASFGEQSSLPHGSVKPRPLREGDVVLMDGGCGVEGYRSDVSRTIVYGKPTDKQLRVWTLEVEAQMAAYHAAGPGVPHEEVDAAARKVIVDAGYGPGYKVPGLPHRTGHGIGLDGHEWTYLVKGNTEPMRPGMCFTNEPMIVIPGEFGIRQEDDMHITEDGVKWFTHPSPSIDQPFVD